MPAVLADLSIEARWIVPMSMPGRVLENHTLVVRDGRILDLLPSADAALRYTPTVFVHRPAHLLMPGMINAATHCATTLFRAASPSAASPSAASQSGAAPRIAAMELRTVGPEFVSDGVLMAIAEMLCSGVTCFADRYYFPEEAARIAGEQGLRAVIGIPVNEGSSPWAGSAAECLTKGLSVRDQYKGHPLISTVFAPHAATLSDSALARIATLADELDAGITLDLHASETEIAASIARCGMRPIERLWQLGLLTPALNAVHMTHATAEDAALAQRTGISVSLCPQSSLRQAGVPPPAAALAASGIRMALGSGGAFGQSLDIWGEMKLLAQVCAWDVLAMATRGGAAALGLDADLGTLEPGKWADLCCVDLAGPATQPLGDPIAQLVFSGGRDMVSDVWVAGRQLLADGEMTRLDWRAAAERAAAWGALLNTGE